MADQLNESEVLETFDDLCKRQVIVYGETEAVLYKDSGFPLQFRLCNSLSEKPQLDDGSEDKQTRTFGPGSDIEFADDKLLVSCINGTHNLILNKFCVFRPQYILPTVDSYRRQDEPLSLDDFSAVLDLSSRLEGPHYTLYNCMEPSGSSRKHKHLQIFKCPTDFSLWPDLPSEEAAEIPYQHFLHRFAGSSSPSAQQLLDTYRSLLSDAKQALGVQSESKAVPHNLVLVRDWMLVIPRRSSNVDGTGTNAAGMMGMVWVTDEKDMEQWKTLGPARVLSQLGVANN